MQRMAEAPPTTSDITVSNSNRGFCRSNSRSPQWGQSRVVPTPKQCPNRRRGEGPSPSRQDPGPVPCLSHPCSDWPAPSSTQTLREPWLEDEGCSAWHALILAPSLSRRGNHCLGANVPACSCTHTSLCSEGEVHSLPCGLRRAWGVCLGAQSRSHLHRVCGLWWFRAWSLHRCMGTGSQQCWLWCGPDSSSWEREHGHGWSTHTVGAIRSTSGLFLPLRPGYRPSTASPRPSAFKLLPRGPRMCQGKAYSTSHAAEQSSGTTARQASGNHARSP
nr:uncharacterized protein LOC110134140 isoform X2 [Odocoileus virginianus texanus]